MTGGGGLHVKWKPDSMTGLACFFTVFTERQSWQLYAASRKFPSLEQDYAKIKGTGAAFEGFKTSLRSDSVF